LSCLIAHYIVCMCRSNFCPTRYLIVKDLEG
jgi:hypothetical protein